MLENNGFLRPKTALVLLLLIIMSWTAAASAGADRIGVFDNNLDGPSIVELVGATGTIEAIVSYPLGLFIDGLSIIKSYPYDPN